MLLDRRIYPACCKHGHLEHKVSQGWYTVGRLRTYLFPVCGVECIVGPKGHSLSKYRCKVTHPKSLTRSRAAMQDAWEQNTVVEKWKQSRPLEQGFTAPVLCPHAPGKSLRGPTRPHGRCRDLCPRTSLVENFSHLRLSRAEIGIIGLGARSRRRFGNSYPIEDESLVFPSVEQARYGVANQTHSPIDVMMWFGDESYSSLLPF